MVRCQELVLHLPPPLSYEINSFNGTLVLSFWKAFFASCPIPSSNRTLPLVFRMSDACLASGVRMHDPKPRSVAASAALKTAMERQRSNSFLCCGQTL